MIGHARVLFDYESQKEDELNIMEGDIVDVTAKYEDGWWYVAWCVFCAEAHYCVF